MADLTSLTLGTATPKLLNVGNLVDDANLQDITDGEGNALPIKIANNRIGIGTTTVPNATDGQPVRLRVMGHADSNSYTPRGAYTTLLCDYEIEIHGTSDVNLKLANDYATANQKTIWDMTSVVSSSTTSKQRLRFRVADWDASNGVEVLSLGGYTEGGTSLRGNVGIGDSTPTYKLTLLGSMYQAGVKRHGISSVTISGGTLALTSNTGPVYMVNPQTGGSNDDLDYITMDGGTPEDGQMIWLMKNGTASDTITINTGTGSATGGATAIEGTTNLSDDDGTTGGLDVLYITQAVISNAYAVVPLMYRASTTNRWLIMDASMMNDVTV